MTTRITAVFPALGKAQDAVNELRRGGLKDRHLTVVTKKPEAPAKAQTEAPAKAPIVAPAKAPIVAPAKAPIVAPAKTPGEGPTEIPAGPVEAPAKGSDAALLAPADGGRKEATPKNKLFGLTSTSIPGAGPFIAAGALAESLGSSPGMVAPTREGSVPLGVIASALCQAGWSSADAKFYATELESGKVLLSVEMDHSSGIGPSEARSILMLHAGKLATAAVTA